MYKNCQLTAKECDKILKQTKDVIKKLVVSVKMDVKDEHLKCCVLKNFFKSLVKKRIKKKINEPLNNITAVITKFNLSWLTCLWNIT